LSHPRELALSFGAFVDGYLTALMQVGHEGSRTHDTAYLLKVFASCPCVGTFIVPVVLNSVLPRAPAVHAGELAMGLSRVGVAGDERPLTTADVVSACSPLHLARLAPDAPRIVGCLAQLGGCAALSGMCAAAVPRDAADNGVLSAAAATVLGALVAALCNAFAEDLNTARGTDGTHDHGGGGSGGSGGGSDDVDASTARAFVRALRGDVLRVVRGGALLSSDVIDPEAFAVVALVCAEGGDAFAAEVLRIVATPSGDANSARVSSVVHALLIALHELGVADAALRGAAALLRADLQRLGDDGIVRGACQLP
jgi:hypothetical protein